jgi:ABC-type transport system involved in multi-copper enzyme maturation permease subunit
MPIYDAAYRRYQARAPLLAWRFWPIARQALRQILLRRMLIVLVILSWLPFLFATVALFVVARMPELSALLAIEARHFGSFLAWQTYFALLLTLFGGAGLVANDLNSGGMLVYLSRAISRRDYVVGKLAAVAALNLCVTLAPAALLYVIAATLLPQRLLRWELAWIGPAILAYSLLVALFVSVTALALSSLTRRVWIAGISLFATLMGLDLAQVVLTTTLDLDAAVLLSPLGALRIVASAWFGSPAGNSVHWAWALAALGAFALAALAVLRRRVRAVEIVA